MKPEIMSRHITLGRWGEFTAARYLERRGWFVRHRDWRYGHTDIDLVVKTPKFIYVMEFKLEGTAEEAMEQIKDKSYTLPFEVEGQQIIRIGMNFSNETRNIEKYIVE